MDNIFDILLKGDRKLKKMLTKVTEEELIEALKLGTIIVCKLNGISYEKTLETIALIPKLMDNRVFFKVGGREYTASHVLKLSSMYLYNFTLVIKIYLFEVFNRCVPKELGGHIKGYDERMDYLLNNVGIERIERAVNDLVDETFVDIIHESFEVKRYEDFDILQAITILDTVTKNEIIDSCEFVKEQTLEDILNRGEHTNPRPKRTVYQSYVMKTNTILYKNLKTKKPTGKKL